jgi:hypothetical protein
MDPASGEIEGFIATIDELYGYYLDSTMGFEHNARDMEESQLRTLRYLPDVKNLDELTFFIGKGNPNEKHHVQHVIKQGEYKRRNARGGQNHIRAAQLFIGLVYEYWDARYRQSIAVALGIKKENLKVSVMGDIRHLRNDILHGKGIMSTERAQKLELLIGHQAGEPIALSPDNVLSLVERIKLDALLLLNPPLGTAPPQEGGH